MPKVAIDEVDETLADKKIDDNTRVEVVRALEELAKAQAEERALQPKAPKQEYVIIGTDPNFDPNTPLFIAKIPETENHTDLVRNIEKASRSYNTNNRKKKGFIRKLGEAFETLKGKKATDFNFSVVSPGPVIALRCDNELRIPDPETDGSDL